MAAAAPHRGQVVSTTVCGAVALGTSAGDGVGIVDTAENHDFAAVVIGDLDNINELAAAVERVAPAIGSRAPAHVLLSAFRVFGVETPSRLRGAFSGAITDGRTLWCFRDQMGYQPLHFRDDERGVFVATEIKQVVAGAGIRYDPDLEALTNLFFLYEHSPSDERRCAIRGVERVPRSHVLRADARGLAVQRYWFPERLLETAKLKPVDVAPRFHGLMEQAVDRSLKGDDVIALSGGVDSPAVAAYAAPRYTARYDRALPALSGLYPKYPTVDESRYINAVAAELGLSLHTYESDVRPTDGMLEWVRLLDGPVPGMSLSAILESLTRARSLGFRNMLTGEFAEFVFDMGHFALDYLVAKGRLRAARRYSQAQDAAPGNMLRFGRRALRAWLPQPLVSWYRGRHGDAPPLLSWVDPARMPVAHDLNPRQTWRDDQMTALVGAFPAIEADSFVQSRAGVGTRRPWTDVDLWEFFLSLPAELKHPLPRSKALVRSLLRGRVPDLILDRTDKTVFDAAIAASIDYELLDRWLLSPNHQIEGVRYDALGDAVRARRLNLVDYMRAKDLAAIHAFLSIC